MTIGILAKDTRVLLDFAFCSQETRPILAKTCNVKIDQIERKIANLNRMVGMLRRFSQICGSEGSLIPNADIWIALKTIGSAVKTREGESKE